MSARYALSLSCTLPGDLEAPDSYPYATVESTEWFAVVAVTEDEAVIEDVLRHSWGVPAGVVDRRTRAAE